MTPPRYITDSMAGLAATLITRVESLRLAGATAWTLALSGGSVAKRLLPHVARAPLPWTTCHVLFADERAVPADDAASNWRLCRAAATGSPMRHATWHRPDADIADLAQAARNYARTIDGLLGVGGRLDVALLGIGEDGHIASAFPGRDVPDASVFAVHDAPKPPPRRLSLSPHLLADARLVCVAAFGAGKAPAVRDAFDQTSTTPAALLLRRAEDPLVLLDADAASLVATGG
jgi:6-phosphogluconolactonase